MKKTMKATRAAAPKDGVVVTRDQAYGKDPQQILDVYQPTASNGAPVVIFIHGGAYVRGGKEEMGEAYGNIATWFARQGMLGINATYRLAPAAKWSAGVDDVRGMVTWAKANATRYGGDPNHIILIGHSAGATHVSGYIFDETHAAGGGSRRRRRGRYQRPLPTRLRSRRSQWAQHAGLLRRRSGAV
jgi:acetyl esterase/lipase